MSFPKDKQYTDALSSTLLRLVYRLQIASMLLLLVTVSNILLVACAFAMVIPVEFRILVYFSLSFVITALVAAVVFDSNRRTGNSYFEQLSDEFQVADSTGLIIDLRIAMRRFTNASSLPLVPGEFGPAILLLVNFGLFFLLVGLLPKY